MSDNKRKYHILKAPELRTLKECDGLGLQVMMDRLPWMTEIQIRRHAKRHGVSVVDKSKPYGAIYSDDEIAAICELKNSGDGLTWAEIATAYNTTAVSIQHCVNRRLRKGVA